MAAAGLGDEILGWARLAAYAWDAESGALSTRLDGCHTQLSVREAVKGRMELREDINGESPMLLYALNVDVAERYMFGLLGDDVRAQLELPFLELPAAADVADGYSLATPAKGFHALVRTGVGPIAAAPWPGRP